jgi:hypothetical protein
MISTAIIAIVALPLIFYLPGYLLNRAIPETAPHDPLERHYERVVVSMLVSGWLAFVLAELHLFSLWLFLVLLVVLCGVGILAARRQPAPPAPAPIQGRGGAAAEWLAYAAIGIVALLLVLPPFEVILGVRDAGVYSNTGIAIARTGGIIQHDDLLANLAQAAQSPDPAIRGPAEQAMSNFLGVQHPERFIATRMRAAGFFINEGDAAAGRVTPQGFHLLPVWIAILTSVLGIAGGLAVPGVMGVMGVWSVGMLGRRLAGRRVGLFAALFLALNAVQVWFARYSTSETTMQFLTFAGLYGFATFQAWRQRDQTHADVPRSIPIVYATIAGVAFGQIVLTRIDFFLVVAPVLLYLLYRWLSHTWHRGHTALALSLGVVLIHAGLHVLFIARAYFFDTAYARLQDYAITAYAALPFLTPLLREVYHTRTGSPLKDPLALWRELAVIAMAMGALLALWRWNGSIRFVTRLAQRWQGWLRAGIAMSILLLGMHTYLVRPQILSRDTLAAIPGCLSPQQLQAPQGACLTLQGYIGAPIAIPQPQPTLDPVNIRQQDPVGYYTAGFLALLSHMEQDESRAAIVEVEGYRERLIAIAEQIAQTGETPTLVEQRDEIISQLDPISQEVIGFSFDELCVLNIPTPKIDDKYVIPMANMVRVGWYLSPLGIALGILGFALWWWRGLRQTSWLFLVVGFVGTFFYIRQTYGTSDQTYIYILRRFVPIAYPALSLGIAYALGVGSHRLSLLNGMRWSMVAVLVAFFVWTGRPIYRHTEYAGAVNQLATMASQVEDDSILLMRGGGPSYGAFRDVPDLVATPLHFIYGLDALTIKSSNPAAYAEPLAAQIRRWYAQGHAVYLVLSASGGDAIPPGFALEPVGEMTLDLPEFEQLTNQKPRNVSRLVLPMAMYKLTPQPGAMGVLPMPLTATDVAAQVRGFYLAEGTTNQTTPDTTTYAWTDGNAILRIPWQPQPHTHPVTLTVQLGGGERPDHLGVAEVCLSLVPADTPDAPALPLGCLTVDNTIQSYHIPLEGGSIPDMPTHTGAMLLRLESETWVPAQEDPRQIDQRVVGVQFGGVDLAP